MKIKPVKVKIKRINVNQTLKVEKTYLGHANAHLRRTGIAQPRGNDPKQSYGVVGPWRQRSRMKIISVMLKIKCISINQVQEHEMTHLGCAHTVQPPGYHLKRRQEVHRPWHRCGRIKFDPTNVSRTHEDRNTHLERIIAIRSIWRPKKGIRRLKELTVKSRMQGELQRDVEDRR